MWARVTTIVLHLYSCTLPRPRVLFPGRCKFNDRISQSEHDRQAHSASITIAGVFFRPQCCSMAAVSGAPPGAPGT